LIKIGKFLEFQNLDLGLERKNSIVQSKDSGQNDFFEKLTAGFDGKKRKNCKFSLFTIISQNSPCSG